jgi:hypothetical protein
MSDSASNWKFTVSVALHLAVWLFTSSGPSYGIVESGCRGQQGVSSKRKAGHMLETSTASQNTTAGQATGDALEDDFGSDLEIDDDDVALTAADKKRKQKRAAVV